MELIFSQAIRKISCCSYSFSAKEKVEDTANKFTLLEIQSLFFSEVTWNGQRKCLVFAVAKLVVSRASFEGINF